MFGKYIKYIVLIVGFIIGYKVLGQKIAEKINQEAGK